jgi:hypothetical protein
VSGGWRRRWKDERLVGESLEMESGCWRRGLLLLLLLEVIIITVIKSWAGAGCVRVVPRGRAAKSTWIVTSACGSFALSPSLGQSTGSRKE